VQTVVSDVNVTGGITSGVLTLGWDGELGSDRGGFGADISAENGFPLFTTGLLHF
jgi:hypothetical protein